MNRKSRVPSTRLGRLVRLGYAAGEMAVGGITEGVKRMTGVEAEQAVNVFLNTNNARKLAKRLAGLRGAAMKMGQILSMEGSDLLPPEFAEALAVLRDAADTMPDSQIRRVLGQAYGKGWEERFKEFDFEPIAAASIGQVHRALTRDGRDIALKIQYPGVARSIDSDVDNLATLLQVSRVLPMDLDFSDIVREAKRQLKQEADYLIEAQYLWAYRKLVEDEEAFVVPRVHEDLTTRHVLAMDYLEGLPLESLTDDAFDQHTRNWVGRQLEHLVFRELFEFGVVQSDPNLGNYLYRPEDQKIILLDFGSTVVFDREFTHQYALISRALIDDDDDGALQLAEKIGYLDGDSSPRHRQRILHMLKLICEPIRYDGIYDFAESDLFARAREAGWEAVFSGDREFKAPPPTTTFLHRKLGGSFLACARIGAQVNVQQLIEPFLPARQ